MPRENQNRCNAFVSLGNYNSFPFGTGTQTGRSFHVCRKSGYGLQLTWVGTFPSSGTTGETSMANSIGIEAIIELADTSQHRVYFNGVIQGTLNPGGLLTSDIIGVAINAGETIWIRTAHIAGAGSFYANRQNYAYNGDSGGSGNIITNTGFVSNNAPCLAPQLATLITDDVDNGVVIFGDSIPGLWADKGLWNVAFESGHATLNLAASSEQLTNWLGIQGLRRRALAMLSGSEYAVFHYSNDIFNGRSLAQVQSDHISAVDMTKRMGFKTLVSTALPRTTSTDGWRTVANQTISNVPRDLVRQQFNDWLRRGGLACHGILDPCSMCEEPTSIGKFRAGGANVSTGTFTAVSAGLVTDTSKSWTPFQWVNYVMRNDTTGATCIVSSNSANTINYSPSTLFTVGNSYSLYNAMTADGIHLAAQGVAAGATVAPGIILR